MRYRIANWGVSFRRVPEDPVPGVEISHELIESLAWRELSGQEAKVLIELLQATDLDGELHIEAEQVDPDIIESLRTAGFLELLDQGRA